MITSTTVCHLVLTILLERTNQIQGKTTGLAEIRIELILSPGRYDRVILPPSSFYSYHILYLLKWWLQLLLTVGREE